MGFGGAFLQAEEGDAGDVAEGGVGGEGIGAEEVFGLEVAALPDEADLEFGGEVRRGVFFQKALFFGIGILM